MRAIMNKSSISEIYERDKKKQQLFVYATAKRDITLSKQYVEKIKEEKGENNFYGREANILSLYIIYGRMFSKNFNLPQLKIKNIGCNLTKEEDALHNSLINMRNKIFAHSDAEMNKIQIHRNNEGILIATPTNHTTLIDDYHETALSLFIKIENAIDKKIETLLNELYEQNDGYKVDENNYVLLGYSNTFWERIDKKPN